MRSVPLTLALDTGCSFEDLARTAATGLETAERWQECFAWSGLEGVPAPLAGPVPF